VVWLFVWFMVVLKLPILYLAYILWWAVKDPPQPGDAPDGAFGADGGSPWRPRRRSGNGPHGRPDRRPVPLRARAHH
jgi:hypothetical protein